MIPRLLLSCLSIALLLPSCKRDGATYGPASRPRHENVFYLGGGAEPESIDPGKAYDSPGFNVSRNLFEGLMRYDPRTLKPLPGVADRYEESEDGKHFLFHLRPDAKWSNGRPVTAADFEWSWKRVLAPETGAQYAALLWDLEGGKAFADGIGPADAVGLKALDDRTLEVKLERPIPWFVELLSFGPFTPVPREIVEKWGIEWTRPEHIVTNGPFVLSKWVINYEIELGKSLTYWGRDEVRLDKAVFVVSDDNYAMMRLYRTGELDWIGSDTKPPQEYLDYLATRSDYRTSRDLTTYFYWFNLRDDSPASALKDKRVRKALDMSIDKESIVKFVMRGGERPAGTVVPDLFVDEGYVPPPGNPYDPEGARKLLAAAGYGPGGKRMPPIELIYNTHEGHRMVAEALQQMWKKELGIDVEIVNQEWKVYMNNRTEGYFQIARAGWTGDFQDPYSFLSMFVTGAEMNEARWSNAEYDRLIDEALTRLDTKSRYELYAKAEAILVDELPVLPVYFYSQKTLQGSWVKGWYPNAQDIHPLRDIWLESK
ncbi:peptide ABC transporter substrate-binding protein [Vulgatibacter incomptus]|uniref:peptide ABC transporter substrate-binding protein n=1 Tax=Vulgatibacter incomptus TaxID=1391653 RepID=UPI0006816D51|nr:peptide ABC transporter substrate-binding protein [Vulgatibacter incomptus]